jgi:signal transduction histidine kinase
VVTASATREGAAREFRIWADEFVPLPVDGADLLRRIRAQVRVKQCQESLTRRGGNADAPWPPEPCTDPDDPARTLPAAHVRTIAHELNQPLTSIMGYAEMLRRRLPGGSAEHRYAGTIFSEAERLAAIVKRLGRMARGEPPGKEGDGKP